LPLIFGKWDILKTTLKVFSAYNFDIIVDKSIRQTQSNSFSITQGGNAELLYSISEISSQNRNQLYNFVSSADAVFMGIVFDTSLKQNNNEQEGKKSNDYFDDNEICRDNLDYDKLDVIRVCLMILLLILTHYILLKITPNIWPWTKRWVLLIMSLKIV
jgi:hypothetical protein